MPKAARLLALLALLLGGISSSLAAEYIERFVSDVKVKPDGTLSVTETIRVHAEGDRIRRGIFRDFPLTFEDASGRVRRVSFRLLGVTRDGRPEPHHTRHHGDYLRIYSGEEDVFLERGFFTYAIRYETDRQLRWFDAGAELNWNVTGNQWDFPIIAALSRVTPPAGAAPVRWTAYTGRDGERGTDWRGGVEDGVLVVQTTRSLAPGEGFTIVAEFPAGAVAEPDQADKARYFFLDYRNWIIGGIGLLAVLAYYLFAWNAVGRDPKGGVIIPLFKPPAAVSPALANYIDNWGIGGNLWKAFTAAALSLAVRGLLVFESATKNTLTLRRTDASVDATALAANERALLHWVEGKNGVAEISRSTGKDVAAIAKTFKKSVEKEGGTRYFRRNLVWFAVGTLLSIATVLAIVVFGGMTEEDIGILMGFLIVSVVIGIFVGPALTRIVHSPTFPQLFGAILSLLVVLYISFQMIAAILGTTGQDFGSLIRAAPAALGNYGFIFALVTVLPLVNGLFLWLLRAPTAEGRPVMDQIEGLRLYMETAESGRLNIAGAPDLTTEHFEELLPYAVALDVERPWADAFAAALARAHPGEAEPMSHYHSRWNGGRSWSSGNFGRSLASSMAATSGALAASVPRSSSGSSGFSGGGGAGRGGGGGGGGGW